MAKQSIARRKVTKNQSVTVLGTELTAQQHEKYQRTLNYEHMYGCVAASIDKAKAFALEKVFDEEKATTHAQSNVRALADRAISTSMAFGSLQNYQFTTKDQKVVGLGNEVIKHCAEELFSVAMELVAMHDAIAREIDMPTMGAK